MNKRTVLQVLTSVLGFTLMLFAFVPGALGHPARTFAYGLAWGAVVIIGCYLMISFFAWVIRVSQATRNPHR